MPVQGNIRAFFFCLALVIVEAEFYPVRMPVAEQHFFAGKTDALLVRRVPGKIAVSADADQIQPALKIQFCVFQIPAGIAVPKIYK